MAYTQDDLTAVQQAIVALATGKRIASVRLSDNTTIQYEPADLGKLQALEAAIRSELESSQGRRRSVVVSTSKGLYPTQGRRPYGT